MNLGFWGLQDTPEKFFWTFEGDAPPEKFENGPLRSAKMHFLLIVTAMK